jgi:hypothetical protein
MLVIRLVSWRRVIAVVYLISGMPEIVDAVWSCGGLEKK